MKYTLVALAVIVLVSCSGTANQTPSSSPIETAILTVTEQLETVTVVTKTSLPHTQTPEVIPTVIPSLNDLPSWLKDSNPNVLAALITDDPKRIRDVAFFNAATGERYEIPMPKDTSGFFWYDNMNFGFLSKDLKTAYHIDFKTGNISIEAISSSSTRLLDKAWVNGLVRFKETNNQFVFDKAMFSYASKNKSFVTECAGDPKTIVVTETTTGQAIWESDAIENVWVTGCAWSPVDDNQLVFIQGSPKPEGDFVTESISLTIVDVTTGKIISTHSGNFGGILWSPDGAMILYQDPLVHYHNYGIPFQDAPCILFLATGETRCLRAIPRLVPNGYKLVTTSDYEWGVDSRTIIYAYLYNSQSNDEILGNLCMYSLINGSIACPTQNLEALHGQSAGLHNISPNQEYIRFCYSVSTPLNDYADTANDGVIKLDGSGFFSWTGAIQDGGPNTCSFDTLWRPLP